jgi:uncharacterized protein involved in outer membrane biogenesis
MGLSVTFQKMHFSFYPTLGMRLDQTEIKDPNNAQMSLATISQFTVGVQLLPLLIKHVDISNLYLDGATFNVTKDGQGNINWLKALKLEQASDAKTTTTTTAPSSDAQAQSLSFFIPKIAVDNMTLNWKNQKNGQMSTIQHARFTAANIQNTKPFPIDFSFDVKSQKPDIQGNVSFKALMQMQSDNTYVFSDLRLQTSLSGNDLPEKHLDTKATGQLVASAKRFEFKPLSLTLNQSVMTGEILVKDFDTWATEAHLITHPFGYGPVTAVHSTIDATLSSPMGRLDTLNGNLQFTFEDGTYQGINVLYFIDLAKTLKNHTMPPAPQNLNQTKFGNIKASAVIKNGVLSNHDLVVSSPLVYATGEGHVDLVNQRIDYALKVSKANDNDLDTQNVPLTVTGTFSDYKVKVDMSKLVQNVTKTYLKKGLSNLINQQLPGKGGDIASALLKNLNI